MEPRLLLVHYLRERVGKVGTPVGCDTSNCGACTVHARRPEREELQPARRAGRRQRVTTIEGLANGEWHQVQTVVQGVPRAAVRLLHARA